VLELIAVRPRRDLRASAVLGAAVELASGESRVLLVSERLLKTVATRTSRPSAARRPTRLVLQDALKKGDESILDYSDLKLRDLPDRMFTKEYLRRL